MSGPAISRQATTSERHRTSYLAAGPEDGPLAIFVHGHPDLGFGWRHQLAAFAALGFRAVAPDMRGCGDSGKPREAAAYAQAEIVADMLELLDHLGRERCLWVGHDWGAAVVWNIASHHPERCVAVANLSVPYRTLEAGWPALLPLVDRELYPEAEYPFGQWDYMRHYEEDFEAATAAFDADVRRSVKALFRGAYPQGAGKPAYTASIRRRGGWFGGAGVAPELPLDERVLDPEALEVYVAALTASGFSGPNAWYLNFAANAEYAEAVGEGGRLAMPVLFLANAHEYTCETVHSRLAEPMRELCADLTFAALPSGHWIQQERPAETNAALLGWLARRVPGHWPPAGAPLPPR